MASEIIVQTIKGPTSGANANKILIPSGQTLDASAGGFTPSAGQVVQTLYAETRQGSENVTWSVDASTPSAQYGATTGLRTYTVAQQVSITKKHPDSYFMCWGYIGFSNYISEPTMAHGMIITLDDVQAIDMMDYPYYDEAAFANVNSFYKPPMSVQGVLQTNSGISSHTIRLRPFGYMESGSGTLRYKGSSLIVQEIAG